MFKPLPDNLIGTVENNTRYATELVVSDNIYTALTDIAGAWTYLCLEVGQELEVIKVTDLLGSSTIRAIRGVEGTKRLVLVNATAQYLPTVSSIYDSLSSLEPVVIEAEGGITVNGYSISYPKVTLESDISGVGTLVDGNTIVINERQDYIGCTPYHCPTPTVPKFILTSRPYALENIEGIVDKNKATRSWLLYRIVEEIQSNFTLLNVDIYGGLVAFTAPVESMESAFELMDVSLYGGLVAFTAPVEAIDSMFDILHVELYGDLVTYSFNESMESSCDVVSGELT
jgi:hypothetical protein